MSHRQILILASLLTCLCAAAQSRRTLKDSVAINFRQSKVYLDTAYMDNTHALQHARRTIDFYNQPDSDFVLTGVTVVGGASPEGSVKFNEWLSHRRAERIFDYIGSRYELPDSLTSFTFLGRDWEGLRRMVVDDPDVPDRDDVLALLDEIIATYRQGETEEHDNLNRLKRLHNGFPYLYMYNELFPTLRASKLVLTFSNPRPGVLPLAVQPAEPVALHVDLNRERPASLIVTPLPLPPQKPVKPFYMALKSNLVYDLLAAPNLGIEFYLGKNLSIAGNWMYAWWDMHPKPYWWRIYGGDLALRWWFGQKAHEKPLTGHHIGLYGSLLTYDFEWGGTGYMGGIPRGTLWDRCNHFYGIEYGYSLPIARRWNLDFNIGFGHWGGEYQVYDPMDGCYVYRETRHRNYWGPTKVAVSLTWLIGRGNYNKKYNKLSRKGVKEVSHE